MKCRVGSDPAKKEREGKGGGGGGGGGGELMLNF